MNFLRSISLIVVGLVLVFALHGCDETKDKKKDTELTQQQADQVIAENEAAIAAMANFVANEAVLVATSGDPTNLDTGYEGFFDFVTFFKPAGYSGKIPAQPADEDEEFIYDGAGCWVLTADTTDEAFSFSIDAEVCFDVVTEEGYPIEGETDAMDVSMDFGFGIVLTGEDFFADFEITLSRVLSATGIVDFSEGMGNLTLDGTEDQGLWVSSTSQGMTQDLATDLSYTINEVQISPTSDYPVDGSIDFSISFEATPALPDEPNFTISGTIEFDGTDVVTVTLSGFQYSLNLTSGDIS